MHMMSERKVVLGYLGSINGMNIDELKAIELLKDSPVKTDVDQPDTLLGEYRKFTVGENYYFVFYKKNGMDIYKSMPLVHSDDLFHWVRRSGRGRVGARGKEILWCEVLLDYFIFNITYNHQTNETRINACSRDAFEGNGTRCKLASTVLHNAGNEEIKEWITNWVDKFKRMIAANVNLSDLKNYEISDGFNTWWTSDKKSYVTKEVKNEMGITRITSSNGVTNYQL